MIPQPQINLPLVRLYGVCGNKAIGINKYNKQYSSVLFAIPINTATTMIFERKTIVILLIL